MAQALLAEAIEVLVVKEELGDQVVGAGLLLEVERAEALLLRGGLDVPLGVARGADAELGPAVAQVGDKVGRVAEVARLAPGGAVAAQGEHVLDPGLPERVDVGVHVIARRAEAGEVREGGDAEVALYRGGDGHGVRRVARAAGGVRDRDPVRAVPRHLARHLVGGLQGKLPLGREDLERERLPRG